MKEYVFKIGGEGMITGKTKQNKYLSKRKKNAWDGQAHLGAACHSGAGHDVKEIQGQGE